MQTKTYVGVQVFGTCRVKRALECKFSARAGTDLDLNKASPEFFSEALRKTRSMCKQKRSLVCKQQHMQGQTLIVSFL